jgi:hypothetical protein
MLASGRAALGRKPLDAARGERREERFDALEIAVLEPEAAAGQRTPLAQRSRLVSVRLRWL